MKNWTAEKQRREQQKKNRHDSQGRVDEYSSEWEVWTPQAAARHFMDDLGPAVFACGCLSDDQAKTVYRNLHTGWTIKVDVHGRYFTIHCPVVVDGGQTVEMYVARNGNTHPSGNAAGFHFRMPSPTP